MKKITFLLIAATLLFAAQIKNNYTIQGIVTDRISGEPLVAASILVKGTSNGIMTDIDGTFSLAIPDSCITLIISFIGYETKEITNVCNGDQLKIGLTPGKTLEEVVVVGEAIKMKKMMTGSSVTVPQNQSPVRTRGYSSLPTPYTNLTKPSGENQPDHNTEDYATITENRFLEATQNPLSTFSIDVDAASYSNMRRFIQMGSAPPKDAIRIEELVNYFNYEYPQPQDEHPFEVVTEISECPWQPAHRLVHIGLQGKQIPMEHLPASNLVFLIDVSGSMNAQNKLPLLVSSFKLLTDQLREQDRVAIVVYAGAAGMVLPPTSGADKQKIKDALSKLQAGGSTAGGAGIKLAYETARENFVKGGNNRVILATDGDFNIGASSDAALVEMIEKERKSGVFLTVLGFGMGNYKDNKMQELANKGNGNHAYIDNISEAKKVLVSEFGGTMFTIAKDVKLQIEFNPAKVQGYRLIGYENRLLNKEDFNDDKKDAGELGSGHTVTALYEIIPAGIESTFLATVDDLKYQKKDAKVTGNAKELMTIKLRYKQPDGNISQLIEKPIVDANIPLKKTSDNFRWSAAVAEFGMLLRDSEFISDATFSHCKKLAESAKGKDANGYRRELIDMIDTMRSIAKPMTAEKN